MAPTTANLRSAPRAFLGSHSPAGNVRRAGFILPAVALLAGVLLLPASPVFSANDAFDTSPASGSFTGNFTLGTTTPAASGTGTPTSGDSLYFGTSSTTTLNDDLTAGTIFAALVFNSGASAFTIGGNAFTLGTATAATAFTNSSGVLQTINDNITFGNAVQTIAPTSGGLTLGGTTAVAGTAAGLTLSGGGTLTLNASGTITSPGVPLTFANTSGETLTVASNSTVTAGALVGGGSTGGTLSIASGSTFISNTSQTSVIFSGAVTGSGTLELGQTNSTPKYEFNGGLMTGFSGTVDFFASDIRMIPQVSSPTYTVELAGASVDGAGDYTINTSGSGVTGIYANNIELASNGGYIRFNSNGTGETLSGAVTGTGTFVLANGTGATNAYNLSGNWNGGGSGVFARAFTGTVQIGAASGIATGAGLVNINSATSSDASAAYVLANSATANSVLNSTLASGGTVNLGSLASTLNGSFGGIVENNVASTTATFSMGALGTNTSFAGVIQNGTGTAEVTALTKVGTGTLTLTGASTYTGATNFNGGILNAGVADVAGTSGAFGKGGNLTFGGGTLQYSAASASTDYSSRIVSSTAGPISIDTNGQTATFASALAASNTGGLTKIGTGTLNLTAANLFTGATMVSGGTLSLGVANALATTSGITVNAGTLALAASNALATPGTPASGGNAGQVPVTLGGGTLLRGAGVSLGSQAGTAGTVGIGALTLMANSTLDFGTGGKGTLNFNSFSDAGSLLTVSDYTSTYSSSTDSGAGMDGIDDRLIFNQDMSTYLGDFSINGQTPTELALGNGEYELIAPVPEPATVLGGVLMVVAAGWRQRRSLRGLVASFAGMLA